MTGLHDVVACVSLTSSKAAPIARRELLTRVAGTLGELLAAEPATRERLLELPAGWPRIISAPWTFSVLTGWLLGEASRKDTLAWLNERMAAEECRTGVHDHGAPHWTALRDTYVRAGSAYRAPLLREIVVDCRSPATLAPIVVHEARPWLGTEPRRIEPAETDRVLERLALADQLLSSCPEAHQLVHGSIKVLRIRTDDSNWFTSASTGREPGRATLNNPQLDHVTPEHIADALLHEAVHNLLYSVEQAEPFTAIRPEEDQPIWLSPWTGTRLSAHAFSHACHVWWCLAHFWHSQYRMTPSPTTARLRHRAAAGFAGNSLERTIHAMSGVLTPEALEHLAALPCGWEADAPPGLPWN